MTAAGQNNWMHDQVCPPATTVVGLAVISGFYSFRCESEPISTAMKVMSRYLDAASERPRSYAPCYHPVILDDLSSYVEHQCKYPKPVVSTIVPCIQAQLRRNVPASLIPHTGGKVVGLAKVKVSLSIPLDHNRSLECINRTATKDNMEGKKRTNTGETKSRANEFEGNRRQTKKKLLMDRGNAGSQASLVFVGIPQHPVVRELRHSSVT